MNSHRPLPVQISRFDRFKDPVGVVAAYRMVRKVAPIQLVLAGGSATDDPEGKEILEEVLEAAGNDPDIHILLLPHDSHKTVNALQRLATIILQKSTREGFGLTVTEGMWKGKPVIGGDVGGIRLLVVNHHTGFLVNTPEGGPTGSVTCSTTGTASIGWERPQGSSCGRISCSRGISGNTRRSFWSPFAPRKGT